MPKPLRPNGLSLASPRRPRRHGKRVLVPRRLRRKRPDPLPAELLNLLLMPDVPMMPLDLSLALDQGAQ